MRWVFPILAVVLLQAPAYAAVGDLTLKPCDPRQMGGWVATARQGADIGPAPAGCGTVNPAAKVLSLHTSTGSKLTVQAALDSARPDDKVLNLLRIDVTGKGQFKDAPTIEINWPKADGSAMVPVGPLNVQFTCEGRQVPATVSGVLMAQQGNAVTFANLAFGSCLEGQCAFGDKTRTIRLIDRTGNGTVSNRLKVRVENGVPCGIAGGDQVLIDSGDGKFSQRGAYGQLMFIDGKWYNIAVSDDGKKVTATPPKSPSGTIKVDADKWTAFLLDTEHALSIKSDSAALEVPAGKYYVQQATLIRGDTMITLQNAAFAAGKASPIEVVAGKTTERVLGPPLKARLEAELSARNVTLKPTISDPAGLTVGRILTVSSDGTPMSSEDAGTFEIFGPDGKLLEGGKLAFQ